ncbi:MAG: LCP family protein [Alkalibacterium sp.]|uniref:LCP family protein n=1 Tax=Alkalibacterium TaxID=99906 RepID=UPI000EE2074E|nr:LCP family protein [Alkalibacterium sp.]MDN6193898.1 LCP family protein [Alkalibacterium sp.]MDN6293007.1 LCP family protein [Alkalibacterium sp.]MDN6294972.1 LCP family protein [Alkalibacterium sp.]MDN6326929.1 LCP family protein [Alkalibacterium sp.]MDN6398333.1 LCP family protein [Alkalibacterium sp.]
MRSDKHKNKRKWLKRSVLILSLLIITTIGIIAGYYANEVREFLNDVNKDTPEELQDTSIQDKTLRDLQPISFLIAGLDAEGSGESRRSDSIIIATVNPEKESTKLLSIPRDTLVTLPESKIQEKFNAVYPEVGISGLITFVQDYLDIPISFYTTLNFEGLVDLVDSVGGITVNAPFAFTVQDSNETSDAIVIEEGFQKLNGEEALGYARMRKQDPRGDFGRQERQREVIAAVVDELVSLNSVTNFTDILNAIRPNLQTNMSGQQMITFASNYMSAANNIESVTLSGEASYEYIERYNRELYVWNPYEESLKEAQNTLREHLNLDSNVNEEDIENPNELIE